jgi:hypothetical protein
MFVVYLSPSDYPGEYVVRKWYCDFGPDPVPAPDIFFRSKTFAECDNLLSYEMGLVRLTRDDLDDPCIICTYL